MEIRNQMDLSRFAVSPTVSRRFTKIEMIAMLAARLACVLVQDTLDTFKQAGAVVSTGEVTKLFLRTGGTKWLQSFLAWCCVVSSLVTYSNWQVSTTTAENDFSSTTYIYNAQDNNDLQEGKLLLTRLTTPDIMTVTKTMFCMILSGNQHKQSL